MSKPIRIKRNVSSETAEKLPLEHVGLSTIHQYRGKSLLLESIKLKKVNTKQTLANLRLRDQTPNLTLPTSVLNNSFVYDTLCLRSADDLPTLPTSVSVTILTIR